MIPDFSAVNGTSLSQIIGALLTIVLIASVAALVISGIAWAFGQANGNYQAAAKGKIGVIVSLAVAICAGAAVIYINWLINLGETL
jgi:cytochrome bd-type quinol oxidase subunit 2